MITCPWLGGSGRLGNQLWQVASTLGIAATLGEKVEFPEWAYTKVFCVPSQLFSSAPQGTPVTEAGAELLDHLRPEFRTYLQDFGLWSHIESQVREYLQPSHFASAEYFQEKYDHFHSLSKPVVGMHIRRGDNATSHLRGEQGYHPLRPTSYYHEGLQRFPDARSVAVFSDDIPWCRQTFAGLQDLYELEFFEGGPPRPKEHEPEWRTAPVLDWIDLIALSTCQYFIMSNSTYSWWGAFLSGQPGEHIIYPWPFFGPKLRHLDASLMFPREWQRLEHD